MRRRDFLAGAAASAYASAAIAQNVGLSVPGVPNIGLAAGLTTPAAASGGPTWITAAPTLLGDLAVNNSSLGPASVILPTNGWVMRLPTSLGAVSCDPSKVTLTVTDFGWDTDGAAKTWTRTVTGTGRVFKPYPDGALYTDSDQAAGVFEIAFDQQLYNSAVTDSTGRAYASAITAINVADGFATGATAGTYTGSITRLDSKDYPLPIWKHVDHLDQLMDADHIVMEWAAVHEWAQKGSQLACLEAWARVGGVDGPVARAMSMADSRWTADGAVPVGAPAPMHVPVFSTSIYGTGLADGIGSIRSTAKPWIGPAVNSFDAGIGDSATSLGGSSTGISFNLMADMPFVKDNAGKGMYTRIYAWVNQDGTGLVGSSLSGIFTSNATDPGPSLSYQTFADAMTAGQSYNTSATMRGTGKTHTDCDGLVIMLRDVAGSTLGQDAGAYSVYKAPTMGAAFTGVLLPVEIRAASGVTSALCRMRPNKFDGSAITAANKRLASKIKLVNVLPDSVGVASGSGNIIATYIPAGGGTNTAPSASTSFYCIYENCDVQGNGVDGLGPGSGPQYSYRTRFKDAWMPVGFANWNGQALAIGCGYFGISQPDQTCSLACYGDNVAPQTYTTSISGPQPRQTIMFNSRFDCNNSGGVTFQVPKGAVGLGIVGTMFRNYGTLLSRFIYLYGDSSVTPINNLVVQHTNTPLMGAGTGTRWNMMYADTGWVRIDKEASFKFNAFAHTAIKDSYFGGDGSQTPSHAGASSWSNSTAYNVGQMVWDPATGSNTVSTSNIYQAKKDVPAGTALSNTSYWYNAGVTGNAVIGAQPGRVGNKRVRFGVNCLGNVNGGSVQGGASDHTPGESTNSWLSDIYWPGSGTSWGNADPTAYFVNDNTTAIGGLGDYHPSATGPLVNMVPVNMHVAPFDYLGTVRKSDGTGAAGALEAA